MVCDNEKLFGDYENTNESVTISLCRLEQLLEIETRVAVLIDIARLNGGVTNYELFNILGYTEEAIEEKKKLYAK